MEEHDFDTLVAEARALIPALHPGWTDHNPTDPGIVLVELLAWLTEMLLYRADQIPDEHVHRYLELLGGPRSDRLADDRRATMAALRERFRAVTPDDYEHLVGEVWPTTGEAAALPPVRRVRCLPGRDLTGDDVTAPAPAHVSVVVVPEPTRELTKALLDFLEPRRILTVRHHVVGPSYVEVTVSAVLALPGDVPPGDALDDAQKRLRDHFDVLLRPFGQEVHPSEIYALLERSSLVDYVEDVRVTPDARVDAHQLVRLAGGRLLAYDGYRRTHTRTWTGAA